MKNHNERVSEALRLEILKVYKTEGTKAATELCISLGLSRRYYSSLASSRGVAAKKTRPLTTEQKAEMRRVIPIDDSNDHRWQWAVERGPVVAP